MQSLILFCKAPGAQKITMCRNFNVDFFKGNMLLEKNISCFQEDSEIDLKHILLCRFYARTEHVPKGTYGNMYTLNIILFAFTCLFLLKKNEVD